MIYGITTSRAHLNKLQMMYQGDATIPGFDGANPSPGFAAELDTLDSKTHGNREIEWSLLPGLAQQTGDAAFAGRYFQGHATPEEVAADEAFSLWAHGEAGDEAVPDEIFPIQRANAAWQGVTARRDAKQLAEMEAEATLNRIVSALTVGDLWCHTLAGPVVVYLETAPDTLTPQYWRYWARKVRTFSFLHPSGVRVSPFAPGIICDFVETELDSGVYWPELQVSLALGAVPYEQEPGDDEVVEPYTEQLPWTKSIYQPAAFSLWARNMPINGDIAPLFSIKWFNVATDIPTHFIRGWDCQTQSVPEGDTTLSQAEKDMKAIVTIDYVVPNMPEDPMDWGLRPLKSYKINGPEPEGTYNFVSSQGEPGTFWFTDTNISSGDITTRPTQIGLDHVGPTDQATYARASNTEVEVRFLPDRFTVRAPREESDGGTDFETDPIIHKPTFTGRYLPPRGGPKLSASEASAIAAGGLKVVSLYQQSADPLGTNRPELAMSESSMREAFEKAMEFGQSPYTPIYFAIDVDVDGNNWKPSEHGPNGEDDGPSFSDVLGFYRTIRRVYTEDYITQDGAVPYYIGAYTPVKVMHALYRAGLATHFWQSMAHTFGRPVGINFGTKQWDRWFKTSPGLRAWPHANLWQIRLAGASDTGFWTWPRNAVLATTPFPQDPNAASWCDINVAWGDPGGWEPTTTKMPVLPPAADEGAAGT